MYDQIHPYSFRTAHTTPLGMSHPNLQHTPVESFGGGLQGFPCPERSHRRTCLGLQRLLGYCCETQAPGHPKNERVDSTYDCTLCTDRIASTITYRLPTVGGPREKRKETGMYDEETHRKIVTTIRRSTRSRRVLRLDSKQPQDGRDRNQVY